VQAGGGGCGAEWRAGAGPGQCGEDEEQGAERQPAAVIEPQPLCMRPATAITISTARPSEPTTSRCSPALVISLPLRRPRPISVTERHAHVNEVGDQCPALEQGAADVPVVEQVGDGSGSRQGQPAGDGMAGQQEFPAL
jgi:hypothetical protein